MVQQSRSGLGAHVAAFAAAVVVLLSTGAAAVAAPGELDPTFSGDGVAQLDPGTFADANDVATGADGKPVLGGWTNDAMGLGGDFLLARTGLDGAPDTGFSGDGLLTTSVGSSKEYGEGGPIVLTDGRILQAGSVDLEIGGWFGLARTTAGGAPDTSFDGDGAVTFDWPEHDTVRVRDMALVPNATATTNDDDVLVVGDGRRTDTMQQQLLLVRFGPGGEVKRAVSNGDISGLGNVVGVAAQGDKPVIAGTRFGGTPGIVVARLAATGQGLDGSFGASGQRTEAFGGTPYAYGLALQPDGRLLVAASVANGMAVARFTTDGAVDTSFDGDGLAQVATPGMPFASANDVVVQADGKIVAAGTGNVDGSVEGHRVIAARLMPSGAPDPSFALRAVAIGGGAFGYGVGLDPQGRTLIAATWFPAGTTDARPAIVRLQADPAGSTPPAPAPAPAPAPDGPVASPPEPAPPAKVPPVLGDYMPQKQGSSVRLTNVDDAVRDIRARLAAAGFPDHPIELIPKPKEYADQLAASLADYGQTTPAAVKPKLRNGDVLIHKPRPDRAVELDRAIEVRYFATAEQAKADEARRKEEEAIRRKAEEAKKKRQCAYFPLDEVDRIKRIIKVAPKSQDALEDHLEDENCAFGYKDRQKIAGLPTPIVVSNMAVKGSGSSKKLNITLFTRKEVRPPTCPLVTLDEVQRIKLTEQLRWADEPAMTKWFNANHCRFRVVKRTKTTSLVRDFLVSGMRVEEKRINGEEEKTYLVELFTRELPPTPPTAPPAPGTPPAERNDFCQDGLEFGPVKVTAECLKREGLVWTSTAKLEFNGLRLEPQGGGAKIVLDPLNLRVAASGKVRISFVGALLGRQIGPFVVYEGSFEWNWQAGLPTSLPGVAVPPSGQGVKLPNFTQLPGLGGLTLPQLPQTGLPDLSKVGFGSLQGIKIPSLDAKSVQIPTTYVPNLRLPAISIGTGPGLQLLGLPLSGQASIAMAQRGDVRGAEVGVAVQLPSILGGTSGELKLFFGANGQVTAEKLDISVPSTFIGPLEIKDTRIAYDGSIDFWSGKANVLFPTLPRLGLGAEIGVQGGQLKNLGVTLIGAVPIGPVLLNKLAIAYRTVPQQEIEGGVGVAIAGVVNVDGTFKYQFGPQRLKIDGSANVGGVVPLGTASIDWRSTGELHAKAKMGFDKPGVKVTAAVEGDFWPNRNWQLGGRGTAQIGPVSGDVEVVLSERGAAGCASAKWGVFEGRGGVGIYYDGKIQWFGGSCGLDDYRSAGGARAAQADGARTVQVPAGREQVALQLVGTDAAPTVSVVAPGGERVTAPADADGSAATPRFLLVKDAASKTTSVLIAKPKGGAYQVVLEPGSSPLAGVKTAEPVPAPQVTAKVAGRGAQRTLRYTVRKRADQVVTFVERDGAVSKPLGTARNGRGTLRFTPAAGRGARDVVALVTQDGLALGQPDVVARYTATAAEVTTPRVRLTRGKGGLTVRWTAARAAARYRVELTHSGGRKLTSVVDGTKRSVTAGGVLAGTAATAKVTALDAAGRAGRPGTAQLKAVKAGALGGGKARRLARGG